MDNLLDLGYMLFIKLHAKISIKSIFIQELNFGINLIVILSNILIYHLDETKEVLY